MHKQDLSKKERLNLLRSELSVERGSFDSHWRDLGDHILPRRIRFDTTDGNRGDKRNQLIRDGSATKAVEYARAGMMSGVSNPAVKWFELTLQDRALKESSGVKAWLEGTTEKLRRMFLSSNLYQTLPYVYGDLVTFGTACMMIEEDQRDGMRCYSFPVGSYYLGNDERLQVRVFARDFRMTVRQLLNKFGTRKGKEWDWSNFSDHVRDMWQSHQLEEWIEVCHIIYPNEDYDPRALSGKYKRYSSCYFETGGANSKTGQGGGSYLNADEGDKFLRESGYDWFPVLAPRWEVTGEDVYGTNCPGMTALSDIKQLQIVEKRILQAIEKEINPPLVGPSSLRNVKTSVLPGDLTLHDSRSQGEGLRPIYQISPNLGNVNQKQAETRQRIHDAFMSNLFMMLTQGSDNGTLGKQMTAREVEERHQEKLLMLGPVLEQLNDDLFDPLIEIGFQILDRRGELDEAPEEIQGLPLPVEYQSVMAKAQKLVGLAGIERFAGFVGQVAQTTQNPAVLDKVNVDAMIDEYAEITGVPQSILMDEEEVALIREERGKAQAQAQQAQVMAEQAKAAQSLGSIPMDQDTALTRMVDAAAANAVGPAV